MRALFKVSFREDSINNGTFTNETVVATDAAAALKKAEKGIKASYAGVNLIPASVELVEVVTVDD